jgi:predicted nucleic acid-binding protein
MMLAVADTTVLSNFVHIGKPELLVSAFDSLVTVRAVMTEIEAGTKLGKIPGTDWTWLVVAELTQDEMRRFEALNQTLGRGEAACLALAEARQALVLTDDRDARRGQPLSISGFPELWEPW